MSIEKAYDEWAGNYDSDRNLTRDLDHQVTRQMITGMTCKSLLEIGCGTGKNTALYSRIAGKIEAVDFSEEMLSLARKRMSLENAVFSRSDICRRWKQEDRSVDMVACNLVLEHVEDIRFIFSEVFRVLEEGGRFFLCALHPYRQYRGTRAKHQSSGNTRTIAAFPHHFSDYLAASGGSWFHLVQLDEWWHEEDTGKPPRLASLLFGKREGQPCLSGMEKQ